MNRSSVLLLLAASLLINGCASFVSNAASSFGDNLSSSILNQDDPELVRAGMPAYILLLDSFLQGEEDNPAILASAATMYASYGAVFADDEVRAARLTGRGREYADDALCREIAESCNWRSISYDAFAASLGNVDDKYADLIFTYGFASLAYIRAHSNDWNALAQIPQATAVMERYIAMSGGTTNPSAHSYLGILMTFRGEMGGQMDQGRAQFEQAITLSDNRDLSAKLEFLIGYARARYDRELNDKLCGEIINASPYADGYTLTNIMAQEEALVLCAEADDYF